MQTIADESLIVPKFGAHLNLIINFMANLLVHSYISLLIFVSYHSVGENFCPPIYPFGNQQLQFDVGVPLISLHSLQINPAPLPPKFATQTVISCQPLMVLLTHIVKHFFPIWSGF